MEIRTRRLVLKPASPEYLESTHAYACDPENTRYMVHLPNRSLEETRGFLEEAARQWASGAPEDYEFVVLLDGVHIGGVNLFPLDAPHTAELGWILARAYWGHGYAAEAARGLMDCAASRLGVRRFIAQCDAENTASRRVMEKLGMRLIDRSGGRKNRSSDEERMELTYEIEV